MINREITGLSLLDKFMNDLINAESVTTTSKQQLYLIHKVISDELDILNWETDSKKATYKLVDMQMKADELMQKLTAVKNSPILSFTNERSGYLNEVEKQLLLVINRQFTSMLLTRNDGTTIDLFNLNFTNEEKRLPRKRKKALKRALERDEKILKQGGAIY